MTGSKMGLPVLATIDKIDTRRGKVSIKVNLAGDNLTNRVKEVDIPASWTHPSGGFAGGFPAHGSTVSVVQGQGGIWHLLGYSLTGNVGNSNTNSIKSFKRNILSDFKEGRHLIQVQNNIKHILDPKEGVRFGDSAQFVRADPLARRRGSGRAGIYSEKFDLNLNFTEASRSIVGPIFRDIKPNAYRDQAGSALTSHEYQSALNPVALDPRSDPGDAFIRNPAFNESREIIYEFKNSFGMLDDLTERKIYDGELKQELPTYFPRRESRADAFSLSLIEPNYLMETIKGTGVDIYGNILDLNRAILPSGLIESLSLRNSKDPGKTFKDLRRQDRKSIAYHFEINSRKENLPDLNNLEFFTDDTVDYSRDRSKFFFDIDKEGQFRMNVPSSSETGNIGLTVRHENYSTLEGARDPGETNPREFVDGNKDNKDIFLDSFGAGAITISGGADKGLDGYAAPTDRPTGNPLKLGTVFHDISNTLPLHAVENPIKQYPDSKLNNVKPVESIFSPDVIISGDTANAGGRSGTITLDGQLSLSIGANTVDRQSLWLDLAGGVVSNIGRDLNDISYAGRFDGDVLIEIGGTTPSIDSRFDLTNGAYKDGVLDIRVNTSNQMHIVRIDNTGLRIFSAGEIDIVSDQGMNFKSRRGNMTFDAEAMYFYTRNGAARWLQRKPTLSV